MNEYTLRKGVYQLGLNNDYVLYFADRFFGDGALTSKWAREQQIVFCTSLMCNGGENLKKMMEITGLKEKPATIEVIPLLTIETPEDDLLKYMNGPKGWQNCLNTPNLAFQK